MTSSFISTSASESSPRESPVGVLHESTWRARLSLQVGPAGGRSTIVARRHDGPFLVQRPFHPEPDGTCHVLLIHPPGGLVTGDALELELTVQKDSRALITAPAATKLYRARTSGAPAHQQNVLHVHAGAELEWLPQETIVFEGARATLDTRVQLSGDARFLGWEIICLGRPAAHEGFARGELTQRWQVEREGRLIWVERLHLEGGTELLTAPYALRGAPVLGTCVAATSCTSDTEHLVEAVRSALCTQTYRGLTSVTARGELILTRYLGPSSEEARTVFCRAWQTLRPLISQKPAILPRIWQT